LRQSLEAYRYHQTLIADCDKEIQQSLAVIESELDVQQHPLSKPKDRHRPRRGWELSYNAARGGIQLAKRWRQKWPDFMPHRITLLTSTRTRFLFMPCQGKNLWRCGRNRANNYLAGIATLAKEAGVEYQGMWATSDYPAEAIIPGGGE
jgi:hypothetical protein